MPRAHTLTVALVLCAALPGTALGATTTTMSAAFAPDRLGAAATVSFGFQIAAGDQAPALLTGMDFRYPVNLGIATSGLGVAACPPARLEAYGPAACPANSRMGYGSALVEIPIGPELVRETARVVLLAGPSPDGYLHLLVSATGRSPVIARIVLSTRLLPGRLQLAVPPIPSLPEAPYVSVTEMHITLGGNLTYYETVRRRSIPYHPAGIGLPDTCPRGGFRFTSTLAFLDGESASTRTVVACPRGR